MNALLPFVISGLALGAVYGLAAVGLTLTYKTSGIFNLGHGALATTAAYLYFWLSHDHGLHWVAALVVSVVGVGVVLGVLMERLAARLSGQPTERMLVGTIGLVLIVQGLADIRYGAQPRPVPAFLPGSGDGLLVAGVVVTYDKLVLAGGVLVIVTALSAFFRWSSAGLAMRGVVEDPELASVHAIDPTRTRRQAWVIGTTFAALSGVLLAPLVGLDSVVLTLMVVQAFAAAAIGRFSSIPLTFVGGLVVGVAADVARRLAFGSDTLSGLPASVPFLVLMVALLAYGHRLVPRSRPAALPPMDYRAPALVRLTVGAVVFGCLVAVPAVAGDRLPFFTSGLVTALLLLSLGLLVRTSGQVSLCHASFAGTGAVAFSLLRVDWGLPWLLAIVLAAAVAVPVGALVALPAIRLSGVYLALCTLGFGLLVQQLVFPQAWMFGRALPGRTMPRPSFADSPTGLYYVVLGCVALAALGIAAVPRLRLGRLLQGLAQSPMAVTAMGLRTAVVRTTVFCLSASVAAVAGALHGVASGYAVGSDRFYGSFNSLLLLAMLVVVPLAEPWSALVLGLTAVIPGVVDGEHVTSLLSVAFGIAAVHASATTRRPAIPARLRAVLERWRQPAAPPPTPAATPVRPAGRDGRSGLVVHDLRVRFGGLVAVDGVTLRAPLGQITGLIGPNGAGKTTIFNACSGFNRRFRGRVILHDHDITRHSPAARARLGLGRTFQATELCDSLTVLENVRLGAEAENAGRRLLGHLATPRSSTAAVDSAVWSAIDRCGLRPIADVQAGALSTGHRRLVELARCLAAPFEMLLLDEPSAGLDQSETARFAEVLRACVAEIGIGALLIEHDVDLVLRSCTYVYVIDSGQVLSEGDPAVVRASAAVRAAYLGSGSGATASAPSNGHEGGSGGPGRSRAATGSSG